jgi:hypothetical protein
MTQLPEQDALDTERDVLRTVVERIRRVLPETWALDAQEISEGRKRGIDARLVISAPDGRRGELVVEAKRLVDTRDVPWALDSLRRAVGTDEGGAPTNLLLAARYLPPETRELILREGGWYADATGNVRLQLDEPGLFVDGRGADRDPWRGRGRPRGTLQGPPAARVVRALVDFQPPLTMTDLVKVSGASTGATYRVVEFVESLGLLHRAPRGPITDVQWRRLLERWGQDYGFARSNTVQGFLEPRGVDALTERLANARDLRYAVTGSLAAQEYAPFAPPRAASVYVDDIADAAGELGLRRVDSGANVLLAAGDYPVVFERSHEAPSGLQIAHPSQVAVDLLSGPGRNPAEGEAVLDWMEKAEPAWRR